LNQFNFFLNFKNTEYKTYKTGMFICIFYQTCSSRNMGWFTYLFSSYYFWVPLVAVVAHRLTGRLTRWFRLNRSLPPGPYGLPLVGYLPFLKRPNDFQGEMTDLSRRYGPIFSLKLGSELLVFLSDHRLIRNAFRRPHVFDARPQNEFFNLVKGYGKGCI